MQKIQRKYCAIAVVIISIVTLSLKDTLNLAHELLHAIPNPFHYHQNEGCEAFYHQGIDPRQSFFSHPGHQHSTDDHANGDQEDQHDHENHASQKNKTELEKTLKTNLFCENLEVFAQYSIYYPKLKTDYYQASFFDYQHPSPPSPPPEISA